MSPSTRGRPACPACLLLLVNLRFAQTPLHQVAPSLALGGRFGVGASIHDAVLGSEANWALRASAMNDLGLGVLASATKGTGKPAFFRSPSTDASP
jgi:hypothetical protein